MRPHACKPIGDRRRTAYSIAEAAAIAGKSTSWARTHRDFGPLVPTTIDGRQAVTADSLHRMLAEIRARKPRPVLRLAVDNTK